jgi:hypothetical protein
MAVDGCRPVTFGSAEEAVAAYPRAEALSGRRRARAEQTRRRPDSHRRR